MNRDQIEARRAELAAEADTILKRDAAGPLADEERDRLTAIEAELDDLKTRERAIASFAAGAFESGDGVKGKNIHVQTRTDPWHGGDLHRASGADLKSRAVTAAERMAGDDAAHEAAVAIVERNGGKVARHILTASSPAYASAFAKVLRNPERGHLEWDAAEAAAYRDVEALERIGSEGTDSAGGYMVPTHLDPSIMLTTAGSTNPFREIARVEQLAEGRIWNGVTSAGVTASWDAEGAEVSDDTPTLGRAAITVYKEAAFVGASLELVDDVSGLGTEIANLFVDAIDELEAAAFATGSGSSQPYGVVTALGAEAIGAINTFMTTNSAIVAGDVMKAYNALGGRYDKNASWVMNKAWLSRIRALGTDSFATQSVRLSDAGPDTLFGRPVYTSSAMTPSLTNGTNSAILLGDFRRGQVIVDRLGARLEHIPHLFHTSNNLPSGQRGWYLWKRTGSDVVNNTAFCMLISPNTAALP